jgi:hypothetical protein
MNDSLRLPTTTEKADLARLLAKRHPFYPFLTPLEMVRVVEQVSQAAVAVNDGHRTGPKQMVVRWNEDQAQAENLTWLNGELEKAPAWFDPDERPF